MTPTKRRSTCRTWPKLRLGSRCWTRLNTSPLALPVCVPPAVAVMVDDDDLARSAPIFQGAFRALLHVQKPPRVIRSSSAAQFTVWLNRSSSASSAVMHDIRVSPGLAGIAGRGSALPPHLRHLPSGDREAGGGQGRGGTTGRCGRLLPPYPCGATGASGSCVPCPPVPATPMSGRRLRR